MAASIGLEPQMQKSQKSLVLAGGGVRLAYHAGVLKALEEHDISFAHIDGTSGGIFGTAMMASGISATEAAKRWRKLDLTGFISALPFKDYKQVRSLSAMGSTKGIRKKIFPALGIDIQKINAHTAFDATFNVCNFSKKTIEAIPHNRVTEDYLVAGMSLPIFMPAIKINGDWYTDAVWIKDANLTEAVNQGSDEIWLIWCIGNTPEYKNGFFNQYVQMIELSANGGLFLEIEWLAQLNKQREGAGLASIKLRIIRPEYPLPLDPDFLFKKINADTLINMGYADTMQYLSSKQCWDFNAEASAATAMKVPGEMLHFRQQFKGYSIINEQNTSIIIQLSNFIRCFINNEIVFQQYSSISINNTDFISGYTNSLVQIGEGLMKGSFNFLYNNEVFTAQIEWKLTNTIDLLIGVDCKTASVTISSTANLGTTETFTQSAINRIKNTMHLNVNVPLGWYKRMQLKRRLIKLCIT